MERGSGFGGRTVLARAFTSLLIGLLVGCQLAQSSPQPASPATSSTPDATDIAAASPSPEPPHYMARNCTRALGGRSVARFWNEVALELIRQVVPAPTVHARNLFHLSAAMWDAWAAYDPHADGYVVTEKHTAPDIDHARETAISFAAFRVLNFRYVQVADLPAAQAQLENAMRAVCLRPYYAGAPDPDSPSSLGERIGEAVIALGYDDGSHEETRYEDPAYAPVNEPLLVTDPGTKMRDPNRWQPLALEVQESQNGLPIPGNVQTFIGPHWGHVTSFAMAPSQQGTPIDPGPPPRLRDPASDDELKAQAVEIIRLSSQLAADDGVTLDIGPGALGDNTLGANDGRGHALNPATGEPYPANVALRADFARVLAEYWADGPKSETPPGHWNVIANQASDALGPDLRVGGQGEPLDRLEWDVKLYFALNGATHDAAVAAWGLKGFYDSPRPISIIRHMGGLGQSSDPDGPAYHPDGLPLEAGLVEVVTAESSADGQRHAHLADHVGEIAIRAWNGFPADPENETSGVGWIRAVEWVPYQRATFVTPAFAGYVSGHSTFSRAAAEVLTAFTGSAFFPGGLHEHRVARGELLHEEGPTTDIMLQWATYYDAADQAGLSRLYMGIHIAADDIEGRKIGSECGIAAWALAQQYFEGGARG